MTQHITQPSLEGMSVPERGSRAGVIGGRHLVAVQTFDIARLTTYPVPIVPKSFIAVSGVGPKGDSNGSGKTSFLGAVSLLLGESQWRLESDGGRAAVGLLWRPHAAGVAAEDRYAPADFGYIVGVFSEPTPPGLTEVAASAHLSRSAVTVWVRLSATPKYVRVRWTHGLHVADSPDETERYSQATRLWNQLGQKGELGPQRMAATLYGEAPRCMAYLDTTMRKSAPSLLSQQMTEMRPDEIGEALIALTGRENLLETEQEQRRALAEHQIELSELQRSHRERLRDEDIDLEGVRARNKGRELLHEGEMLWRLHNARGFLDAMDAADLAGRKVAEARLVWDAAQRQRDMDRAAWEQVAARADLDQAREDAQQAFNDADARQRQAAAAVDTIRNRIAALTQDVGALRGVAAEWSGTPLAVLAEREAEALAIHRSADVAATTARQELERAHQLLRETEAGGGGPAGSARAALVSAGISVAVLLDEIVLQSEARAAWEPRLYPHRSSVVVAPEHHERAIAALAQLPGTSIVLADGPLEGQPGSLPAGLSTSLPISAFLQTLSERNRFDASPDRATDVDLGEVTLGGFADEIAGRAARIAAATLALEAATRRSESLDETLRLTALRVEECQYDRSAGEAAKKVRELQNGILDGNADLINAEASLRLFDARRSKAHDALVSAQAEQRGHQHLVALAKNSFTFAEQEAARRQREHADRENDLRKVPVNWWLERWSGSRAAAETALTDARPELCGLKQGSFRSRAADVLKDALTAYESVVTELPPELEEAKRRRQALLEGEPGVAGSAADFSSIAEPLRLLLDAAGDRDRLMDERIARSRTERERDITSVDEEIEGVSRDLRATQDMTARSLLTALGRISERLTHLSKENGGYGAELRIEHELPTSPAIPWRWRVTPRWRRSATGGMVSYREVANGAQVKVFAIQLVLAALLAAEGSDGRVLVLDELGNSLGDTNRRTVLGSLDKVAREKNLTILGTCQDSVIGDAAQRCGEILWFHHASDAHPWNQPTRAWGHDDDNGRVALVAPWLRSGRDRV